MTESFRSIVSSFIWCAVAIAVWEWVVAPELITADAAEVHALVAKAAPSTEATAVVAEGLKRHPQPTQGDLERMRADVNDVVLTQTARRVTGDPSVPTKAEKERARAAENEARRQRFEALRWDQMSAAERLQLTADRSPLIAFVLLLLVVPIAYLYFSRR